MNTLKKIALIVFIVMCATFTLGKLLTMTSTAAEASVVYSSSPYVTYETQRVNGHDIVVFRFREDIEVVKLN
jgi:hypothetical protein